MRFAGKPIVITGASRGIGAALARRLARGGGVVGMTQRLATTRPGANGTAATNPGELKAEWLNGIPMARAGAGEDVAGLMKFLTCDDAS